MKVLVNVGGDYQRGAKVLSVNSSSPWPFALYLITTQLVLSPRTSHACAGFDEATAIGVWVATCSLSSSRRLGRRDFMARAIARLCTFRSLYPWPDPSLQDREVEQSIRQMRQG